MIKNVNKSVLVNFNSSYLNKLLPEYRDSLCISIQYTEVEGGTCCAIFFCVGNNLLCDYDASSLGDLVSAWEDINSQLLSYHDRESRQLLAYHASEPGYLRKKLDSLYKSLYSIGVLLCGTCMLYGG